MKYYYISINSTSAITFFISSSSSNSWLSGYNTVLPSSNALTVQRQQTYPHLTYWLSGLVRHSPTLVQRVDCPNGNTVLHSSKVLRLLTVPLQQSYPHLSYWLSGYNTVLQYLHSSNVLTVWLQHSTTGPTLVERVDCLDTTQSYTRPTYWLSSVHA